MDGVWCPAPEDAAAMYAELKIVLLWGRPPTAIPNGSWAAKKKAAIHHGGKTGGKHNFSKPLFGPFWPFFGLPGPFGGRNRTPRDILTRGGASISANLVLWEAISRHFLVLCVWRLQNDAAGYPLGS